MNNLKPCPFCGGEAVKVIAALDEERGAECWLEDLPSYGGKSSNYYVVCLKCQGNSGYRRTPQEAIAAWNRRPDNWIPVTERLPESSGSYLCWYVDGFGNKGFWVGYWDDSRKGFYPKWPNNLSRFEKYWMPLPEPPKEVR
jgi:Lar family restriction alleviation protein